MKSLRLTAATAVAVIALLSVFAAAASAKTHSIRWHAAVHATSAAGGFTAVSCPAVNECLAVDAIGQVAWSTKPTTKAWRKAKIDAGGAGLTGISCPLKRFCVAVDANGRYLYSTNPTGGSKHWSAPARIDAVKLPGGGYAGLAGVSCPSTNRCVAVDNALNGNVVVSTNPTRGAKAWRRATIARGQQLTSISCPSTNLCVAAGTGRYYATSIHGVAADWHAVGGTPGAGVLSAIGCALRTRTCVAVGYNNSSPGFALGTSHADGGSWKTRTVEPYPQSASQGLLDGVACPRVGFCVAIDSNDDAYTTNTPVNGHWSAPTAIRRGSLSNSSAISCSALLCLVADSRGTLTSGSVR